jgi:hypothetical protein
MRLIEGGIRKLLCIKYRYNQYILILNKEVNLSYFIILMKIILTIILVLFAAIGVLVSQQKGISPGVYEVSSSNPALKGLKTHLKFS